MNELNKRSAGRFSTADWIVAPIITALVYVIVRTFFDFFDDGSVGSFVFTFSAGYLLILVTAFVYAKKDRRLNAESVLTAVFCAVLGLSVSLYGDIIYSFFTVLLLFALTASLCLSLSGSRAFSASSAYYLFDVLYSMLVSPLVNFVPMTKSAFAGRKKGKGISGAVLGAVFAVPVLAVVILLLTNGDAAFESLTSKFFDVLFSGYGFVSVLVTLVLSVYIFTVMYASRYRLVVSDPEKSRKTVSGFHLLPVNVINGFLGAVSAVYVVYLFSQLTYFFGAFGGKIPESVKMTVAEYSRRGFFEMSAVAFINLGLIFLAVLLAKRADGKIAKSVKGISLFLCVFTEILIMTAMSKMALYISRFGLTRKRVFVTAAILVLFVTFICVMIRLFVKKFPYMKIVFSVFLVTYSLLSVVNVNAVIANYNVDAYLSGRLEKVDLSMLSDFGISSVEAFMKLAKSGDQNYADSAESHVSDFFSYLQDDTGVFFVDENNHISLQYGYSGIYDYAVLKRVQKDSEDYLEILNRTKPRPSICYLFISAEKPIFSVRSEYYWAEYDEEPPMQTYTLYKLPVVEADGTVTLFADYCDENGEYQTTYEVLECKMGGVFEIGQDQKGGLICKSYGEPGISHENAEKLMQKNLK